MSCRLVPLCVSVMETTAPAMTPPVRSETAPIIRPVLPPCERAGVEARNTTRTAPHPVAPKARITLVRLGQFIISPNGGGQYHTLIPSAMAPWPVALLSLRGRNARFTGIKARRSQRAGDLRFDDSLPRFYGT